MKALAPLALVLCAAGCTAVPDAFTCTSDDACRAGGLAAHCERTGLCSLDDASCASGTRYHRSAGAHAGECVPERSCADHPTAVLCEDFEGALDKFTPYPGSRYEIVEEGVHRGRHAAKLSLPAIAVGGYSASNLMYRGLRDAFAQPSFWVRVWLYVPVASLGTNGITLFTVEEAGEPFGGARVLVYADKTVLRNANSWVDTPDLMAPAFGAWSCFVLRVDNAPNAGTTLTGSDVGRIMGPGPVQGATPIQQVALGPYVSNPKVMQPPLDVFYDDVLIDTRPLRCDE